MRLTLPLYKFSMRHAIKQVYKRRAYVRPSPEPKHWYLEDKNVVDPNRLPDNTLGLNKYNEEQRKLEPVPLELRYAKVSVLSDSPLYHEDYIYEYHYNTRMMEGLKQACILTRTEPIFELPQRIKDSIGKVEIKDQDELVQRCIMQANVWDPTKVKLPRRINKSLPGWKFKAEYGIPQRKMRSLLMQNLIRLCSTLDGQYPDLLQSRDFIQDPYVSVTYKLNGETPVLIRGVQDWLLTSTRPLEPVADSERIRQTTDYKLPDISPIAPTIDLQHQHVYKEGENITGYNEGFRFSNPHTLYMTTIRRPRIDEHQARVLMFCFANCVATAKAKYGFDVQELPDPVSIQCVSTDGIHFHFSFFQLNTLDMKPSNKTKNLVWFDGEHAMYEKILPKRAMLRNTRYEHYDPEVFKKILAFYIQGADLSTSSKQHVEGRV